jgi:hypothetical protein
MSAHALFNLNERIHRRSSRLIAGSAIAGMAEFYTNAGSA